MSFLLRLVARLPIPADKRLDWQRILLDRAYAKDISAARKAKDKKKVESLEDSRRFELDLHDEEVDAHQTRTLLSKSRRLHVPVPHRYNTDKTESEYWYEGRHTGSWCLTTRGMSVLREEIRREVKARHETRTHWVVWLSALTGLIGATTGLVAAFARKYP